MLNITYRSFMLSVIMLNVVMLNITYVIYAEFPYVECHL
jgi:hypothetical protein